jgi:hypothetical protein
MGPNPEPKQNWRNNRRRASLASRGRNTSWADQLWRSLIDMPARRAVTALANQSPPELTACDSKALRALAHPAADVGASVRGSSCKFLRCRSRKASCSGMAFGRGKGNFPTAMDAKLAKAEA